jgi:hypothetical protein
MPKGKHRPSQPAKDNHMRNFEEALKDALKDWNRANDEDVQVTFEATVTPNPGGVKEYRVEIKP